MIKLNSLDIAVLSSLGLLLLVVLAVLVVRALEQRPRWRSIETRISGAWLVPIVPLVPGVRVRCMVPLPACGVRATDEGALELVLPIRDEYHYRVRFDDAASTVTFLDTELWQLEVYR